MRRVFLILFLLNGLTAVQICSASEQNREYQSYDQYTLDKFQYLESIHESAPEYLKLFKEADRIIVAQPDSAAHMLKKALELFPDSAMKTSAYMYLLISMGKSNYIAGDFALAFQYNLSGLELAKKISNPQGMAKAYNQLGNVLNMQKKYKQSIDYHQSAMSLAQELNDSALMASVWLNLGISFLDQKDFREARSYFQKSLLYLNKGQDGYMISKVLNQLGNVAFFEENYPLADSYFQQVIDLYSEDNDWELGYAFEGLSKVRLREGATSEAIRLAMKGLQIARSINARWDVLQLLLVLSEAHQKARSYELALEYSKEYNHLYEVIYNDQKDHEINYLQLKLKDEENLRLQAENEILQKNEQISRRILVALALFLILILTIIFLIRRKNKQKERFYKLLEAKNAEIRKVNQELEKSLKTKDKLFSIIAHDLKGPLGSFMNFTDHLQKNIGQFDTETLVSIINSMSRSSKQSYRLLVNLLDWSRAQTNSIAFDPQEIDFYSMIKELIEPFDGQIFNKKIKLELNIPEGFRIVGDLNMIQAIFRNLISNSIKYSSEGDQVKINAYLSKKLIVIELADTGVGMTTQQLDHLNHPAGIHSTPGTNNESGTGLGFLIVSDFVKRHNGSLEVESEAGKGTLVRLSFPN